MRSKIGKDFSMKYRTYGKHKTKFYKKKNGIKFYIYKIFTVYKNKRSI